MARLSLILILITLSLRSFSQSVYRNVIASGGSCVNISGYCISSTIGQIPFQTLAEGTNSLTQGFEQPGLKNPFFPGEFIQVFPNPVSDNLHLVFSVSSEKDFTINVFNLTGTEIQNQLLHAVRSGVFYTMDLSKLPDGMYLLHIYNKSAEKQLFKVIKIEKIGKPKY